MKLAFKQVDVFTATPFRGNPVAVVLGADALETEQMQHIAAWTNLSETTFLLKPTAEGADYRLRIFTPRAEIPFAGHPTIGSAHAALEGNVVPFTTRTLVQECAQGLVRLHVVGVEEERQIFLELPPARTRTLDDGALSALDATLGFRTRRDIRARMIDVGVVWITCVVNDAATVRGLAPDAAKITELSRRLGAHGLTLFAPVGPGEIVVRAFAPAVGVPEDPVTGSANGCIATFLMQCDLLARVGQRYVANQGREVGRDGYVHVEIGDDGRIKLGGASVTCVDGAMYL